MMAWIFLLVAGLCEMAFVVMMKLSEGFKNLKYSILTIVFMAASFFLAFPCFKDDSNWHRLRDLDRDRCGWLGRDGDGAF